MKAITDRIRMVLFGIFVIIVGVVSPETCMKSIGEVVGDAEEYNPIKIRGRQRREFVEGYTKLTQKVD
jgi:hypothetical protein